MVSSSAALSWSLWMLKASAALGLSSMRRLPAVSPSKRSERYDVSSSSPSVVSNTSSGVLSSVATCSPAESLSLAYITLDLTCSGWWNSTRFAALLSTTCVSSSPALNVSAASVLSATFT